MSLDRWLAEHYEGHFDIKITSSRGAQDEDFCKVLEPIAAKLLESFLNCWAKQLEGESCAHNPKHEDVFMSGGQPRN